MVVFLEVDNSSTQDSFVKENFKCPSHRSGYDDE